MWLANPLAMNAGSGNLSTWEWALTSKRGLLGMHAKPVLPHLWFVLPQANCQASLLPVWRHIPFTLPKDDGLHRIYINRTSVLFHSTD